MTAEEFYAEFGHYLEHHGVENFRAIELCRPGRLANGRGPALQVPPETLWPNILPTLRVAEAVRSQYNQPVYVSSGYRDPAYNEAINGGTRSLHKSFNAMDIVIPNVHPSEVYNYLRSRENPVANATGLGLYSSFVHIDTRWLLYRPSPARW